MKFKKFASLILASVITISVFSFPASAETDYTYKLQGSLAEKLKKMDDNESIPVSVWLTDIDYDTVEKKVEEKLKSKVSKEIINLVGENVNTEKKLSILNVEEKKTSEELKAESEKIQLAIETKRKISSDMQVAQNEKIIIDLFNEEISDDNIIYSCKYAPNVEMNLTKKEIEHLISNNDVQSIYCQEDVSFQPEPTAESNSCGCPHQKGCDCECVSTCVYKYTDNDGVVHNVGHSLVTLKYPSGGSNTTGSTTVLEEEKNKAIYNLTGITVLKEKYNLSGTGVKVGDVGYGLPSNTYDAFSKAISENRFHLVNSNINNNDKGYYHSEYCISEIIGEINGVYESIAPNVDMYSVATIDNVGPWKSQMEALISEGVSIINASTLLGSDGLSNYGDAAKWIDAIINTKNVTLVQSAGNRTTDEITYGAMAYNSITVGYYDFICGDVYKNNSSYNSGNGTYRSFKPDIVAPGDMTTYLSSDKSIKRTGGGTSGAAPVVTGIAALLCERYPSLKASPVFFKSLLLNSATYLGEENTAGSNTDFVAFDRKSGAGVINGYRALNCYASRHWDVGTVEPYSVASFSFGVTKKTITDNSSLPDAEKKKVHVTICAEKTNSFPAGTTGNLSAQTPIDSFIPAFEIKVWNNMNDLVYTSRYFYDTKCSVVFAPTVGTTYNVQITRIDNNYYSVPCSAFFTCE